MFEKAVWCVDDQSMTGGVEALRLFTSRLKMSIANKTFEYHMKYQKPTQVEWAGGRSLVSGNLDSASLTIIPAMEDTIADKISLFRFISNQPDDPEDQRLPHGFFPRNVEEVLAKEMAAFAAFIYHWKIPAHIVGDQRFGVKPYHDSVLKQAAFINSGASCFLETLGVFLDGHCRALNTKSIIGSAAQILAQMQVLEGIKGLIRNWTTQSLSRNLMHLESIKHPSVSSTIDAQGVRIWTLKWQG
jgi:hypothetical protein